MLGISDAVELAKKVGDLVKTGATIGLQETIMDLRQAVLNVKEELLQLREDNQTLRAKVSEKNTWDDASAQYKLVATPRGGTVYYADGPPPHYACPTCFASKKIIPLQHSGGSSYSYKCTQCNAYYPIEEPKPPRTTVFSPSPGPADRGGPQGWMGS